MSRADFVRRLSRHKRETLLLEVELSVLHEQPGHVLSLRVPLPRLGRGLTAHALILVGHGKDLGRDRLVGHGR